MLPNDDLARWGEPPTDARELALAELLAEVLDRGLEREPLPEETALRVGRSGEAGELVQVCRWIDEMMATVAEESGLLEGLPTTAGAVELRLSVSRQVGGAYEPVASTHARPCVVRDLRRVPDDPDRVTLRTGDRVRVEVTCDRAGHLTVFNVGPRGGVNLLYPARSTESPSLRAGETVRIADVELAPPAGRERVYAVWSREPLALRQYLESAATVRDMKRVQESLGQLGEDDWHAVMLELDHQA
jgi:hypothetical protein